MLIDTRPNIVRFALRGGVQLAFLLAVVIAADELQEVTELRTDALDLGVVGLVAAALSIFLAFRVSEAYDRWWEARKLWGQLVNTSRDLARQAVTLLEGIAPGEEQARLVRRQIAYVYALRSHLLPSGRPSQDELAPFLEPEELQTVMGAANVPAALLNAHGRHLRGLFPRNAEAHLLLNQMDASLTRLFDVQGGCERIRNTVFPARVTFLTRGLVWTLAILLPVVTLEVGGVHSATELFILAFVSFVFVSTERMGSELKTPFDGKPNSMPMRALARTIEIDLLQTIGATEVPDPVVADAGVLD